MQNAELICELVSTPWAMLAERLAVLSRAVMRHQFSAGASPPAARSAPDFFTRVGSDSRSLGSARGTSIAVVPMYGVLAQRTSRLGALFGITSTQSVSTMLRAALADDSIGGVLLDIDSPGGSVYGIAELAAEIYDARGRKPITAIANSLAASAAYWIGSAASQFYVTPGGQAGSIGILAMHQDVSKVLEADGVKVTMIAAGKYKTEGNSIEPLSVTGKDYMQRQVNDYYDKFTRTVAKHRNVPVSAVRDGMGQGRLLGATQAAAQGMVDGVATFDDAVRGLARGTQRSASQAIGRRIESTAADNSIRGTSTKGGSKSVAMTLRELGLLQL